MSLACHAHVCHVCGICTSSDALTQELDEHCRGLIAGHHAWCQQFSRPSFPQPCIFGNIEHCLPENTYKKGDCFMKKLWDISKSSMLSEQYCFTHGRQCRLFNPDFESDVEIAGLPCWDFSLAGKRLKEHGPTNTVFMSHAKIHRCKATPILIIENVQAGVLGIAGMPEPRVCQYVLHMFFQSLASGPPRGNGEMSLWSRLLPAFPRRGLLRSRTHWVKPQTALHHLRPQAPCQAAV